MKRPRDKPKPSGQFAHSIADHALGADAAHVHGPGDEHDHDHDGHDGMDLLAEGASNDVVLTSIGIDVGSSGTQIVFARLTLERAGDGSTDADTSRPITRKRETLYQSPIFLTPLDPGDQIDGQRLQEIVDQAFSEAKLTPDDIDCGVVILTGAARERDNAAAITRQLAETCGDIVSASAGHHMEARIAAHGSGAVERSIEFGQRFLNVDIGGATAKLAVCDGGRVVATAALRLGGRLVATDKSDRIVRLEPAGQAHAARAGFDWQLGGIATWPQRQAVGAHMADLLVAVLNGKLATAEAAELSLTGPLPSFVKPGFEGICGMIVSGGVGEYVYGRENRSFSDVGLPFGRALAARIDAGALPWPLMPAGECIRATVLGASSYTVQLSGRTGFISAPAVLLPRRNLPVVQPDFALAETIDPAAMGRAIHAQLSALDMPGGSAEQHRDIVLALRWRGAPEHVRLKAFAQGITFGLQARLAAGLPLYLMLDADIAASLGAMLREELGVTNDVLVLDGVELADFDYVDLGRIRLPSGTVPVTIKSLVFRDEQGQKSR